MPRARERFLLSTTAVVQRRFLRFCPVWRPCFSAFVARFKQANCTGPRASMANCTGTRRSQSWNCLSRRDRASGMDVAIGAMGTCHCLRTIAIGDCHAAVGANWLCPHRIPCDRDAEVPRRRRAPCREERTSARARPLRRRAPRRSLALLMAAKCEPWAEYHRGSRSHRECLPPTTNLTSPRFAACSPDPARMHAARSGSRHATTRQGK